MDGTQDASHIWQVDHVNLICGELGGCRRGNHSAALFHSSNQDVRMTVHGDDFLCLFDDDGTQSHRHTSQIKNTAKEMGTLEFEGSDAKRLLLLNRVFTVGTDQTGHFWVIELDLHASFIIKESGCSASTKTVISPREKLRSKSV